MISTFINGGLGNMMFQIAFIESLGKKYGFEVGYDNVDSNIAELRRMGRFIDLDLYSIFKNVNLRKQARYRKIVPVSDTYVDILPADGICYQGYAVSEKNFFSREFILNLFEFSDDIRKLNVEEYNLENSCSVHVRRTDYVGNPGFAQLGSDYYQKATDYVDCDNYIVFSDDIEFCKNKFSGFSFIKCDEATELFLMSQCKHNIIANSTFSWWGAYLNRNPEKIVIAPAEWVGDGRCTTDDIVPKEWIKI